MKEICVILSLLIIFSLAEGFILIIERAVLPLDPYFYIREKSYLFISHCVFFFFNLTYYQDDRSNRQHAGPARCKKKTNRSEPTDVLSPNGKLYKASKIIIYIV